MTDDARPGRIVPAFLLLALVTACDGPPPIVRERASLVRHTKEITSLAFTPDGKTLASRGADAVNFWDVAGAKALDAFSSDSSEMGSIAFSPDGQSLAVPAPGKGAVVWDMSNKQSGRTYAFPADVRKAAGGTALPGGGLAFSPDGMTLAGGHSGEGGSGGVTLWDVATGEGAELGPDSGPVLTLAFAPDGKTLASKGVGDGIDLWNFPSRKRLRTIRAGRSFGAPVGFSPDGKTVVSADDNRRLKLWDVATGAEVASLKWHLKAILSAAWHPTGRLLASGDSGGVILLWDVPTRTAIAHFEGHQGKVWALAFSPDGKTLASAGQDKVVRLWDAGAAIVP